ncbi:MAG: VWA domain-containing protein [Treponema sp.]|nr:VWA domain-containing protein [Treponema sp.]
MNFTCQRPSALFALLILIPAIIVCVLRYKHIMKHFNLYILKDTDSATTKRMRKFPVTLLLRTIFRSIAWVMLVLSYAGFSWGTYLEPIQKSGTAVSMVFDISYSMEADDGPAGLTRLKAAENYASMLLSQMKSANVSVVLAKGEGQVVIPLTDDKACVETLLESLSPRLMTSGGSSLGKGIRSALKSFPSNSSYTNTIWVFTDGDETDGQLENALIECVKAGVSVYLIGFGTEREVPVLAGDGKTIVNTGLRSAKMKKACEIAMEKNVAQLVSDTKIEYIDATEAGSALSLLAPLKNNVPSSADLEKDAVVTYELKPVQRYALFLGLAFFFFILGYVVTELDIDSINHKIHKASVVSLICCLFFTSCSGRIDGSKRILESSWSWYQQKYNTAIAGFLQTAYEAQEKDDFILEQYAVYNLAVSYLMKNENDAALERFNSISLDAPAPVLYATYYNKGVIAFRTGDYESAAEDFRKALSYNGSKIDAKINLELSLMNAEKEARAKDSAVNQVTQDNGSDTTKSAVFERIREYDKKQWKSSEKSETTNSAQDF